MHFDLFRSVCKLLLIVKLLGTYTLNSSFLFQGAINGIDSAGVRVVSVTDVTPVPHNGCRPRKTRRL